jgi:hypothetical protein
MMRRIVWSLALFSGLLMFSLQGQAVYAAVDASEAVCEALGSADTGSCSTSGDRQVTKVIRFALDTLSIAAGIIAVIMIIISGLKYITSQGDSSKAASGQSSIIYAIVGLVIVALAQVIVQFVLTQAT